jgi:uncharacterized protein
LIVDLVGWGTANFYETAPAPATTNTTAILRLSGGCTETDNNAADFVVGAPAPRNTASPFNVCGGPPPPVLPILSCPATLNTYEGYAAAVNVSASDADSIVTSISLDTIDPIPATGGFTLSDLVPAAAVGETATAKVNASADLPIGSFALGLSAVTDDGQTATCTITANVQVVPNILPIGTVQGSVSDTADGRRHASPYINQTVFVQAVITQKMQSRSSSGTVNYGIFIQNTAETADGDPNSSDGIFVFMNRFQDLIGGYVPVVGDEIILSGRVSEYFNMTQISSATMRLLVRSGVDIDAETPAIEADPPDDDWDAGRYWERIEGMRVQVPAGSIVLDGRDVFASTYDGEVWLARGDSWVAQQADPYARRAFRDAHPLDDDPALFDNNNGYRILSSAAWVSKPR